MTITAEQVSGAHTLFNLADRVREERDKWSDTTIRNELERIARQLEHAARDALAQSDIWAEAWVEAGSKFLNLYIGRRKLIEHL